MPIASSDLEDISEIYFDTSRDRPKFGFGVETSDDCKNYIALIVNNWTRLALIDVLNKVQYRRIASVSVTAETVITVSV